MRTPTQDPSWPWTRWPEVREAVRPEIAEMALAASFLASEGLALTPDAYILFVDAVSRGCSLLTRCLSSGRSG